MSWRNHDVRPAHPTESYSRIPSSIPRHQQPTPLSFNTPRYSAASATAGYQTSRAPAMNPYENTRAPSPNLQLDYLPRKRRAQYQEPQHPCLTESEIEGYNCHIDPRDRYRVSRDDFARGHSNFQERPRQAARSNMMADPVEQLDGGAASGPTTYQLTALMHSRPITDSQRQKIMQVINATDSTRMETVFSIPRSGVAPTTIAPPVSPEFPQRAPRRNSYQHQSTHSGRAYQDSSRSSIMDYSLEYPRLNDRQSHYTDRQSFSQDLPRSPIIPDELDTSGLQLPHPEFDLPLDQHAPRLTRARFREIVGSKDVEAEGQERGPAHNPAFDHARTQVQRQHRNRNTAQAEGQTRSPAQGLAQATELGASSGSIAPIANLREPIGNTTESSDRHDNSQPAQDIRTVTGRIGPTAGPSSQAPDGRLSTDREQDREETPLRAQSLFNTGNDSRANEIFTTAPEKTRTTGRRTRPTLYKDIRQHPDAVLMQDEYRCSNCSTAKRQIRECYVISGQLGKCAPCAKSGTKCPFSSKLAGTFVCGDLEDNPSLFRDDLVEIAGNFQGLAVSLDNLLGILEDEDRPSTASVNRALHKVSEGMKETTARLKGVIQSSR